MNREENLILPNLTKLICDGKEREIVPVYKTDKGEYVVSGTELHRILGVRSRYCDWIKNRLNDCDTNLNSYLTVYKTETGNKEASVLHVIAASDRFYEQALKNFDYAIKRKKVFG